MSADHVTHALRRRAVRPGVVLVLVAALAVAACGGSAPSPAQTATTPSPTSTQPTPLHPAQLVSLDRSSSRLISTTSLLLSALNRCIPARRRGSCVRTAVKPAEAAVRRTRLTLSSLRAGAGGNCASQLTNVGEKVSDLTSTLSPMAQSTLKGRFRDAGRLGAQAQSALRTYATATQVARQACAG